MDTNVVFELRKRERGSPKVDQWAREIASSEQFLSVLLLGELRRGAALKHRSDPATGEVLNRWISELAARFEERILPVTLEIAEAWGRLGAVRPIPPEDGLMAATALVHDLTLVTRNTKNVEGLGVALLNPWK